VRVRALHRWSLTPREARQLQTRMAVKVVERWERAAVRTIAGCDVHFPAKRVARGAVVVMSYPKLELLEQSCGDVDCRFPYVPGLLSFRELPALLPLLSKLRTVPDVVLCDGHGVAHPRGFGLASHLGLLLDTPTIGCAKSRLIGSHTDPGSTKGSAVPLRRDQGDVIGAVVRTRASTKPVYVSVGHLVTVAKAVAIVLSCCPRYRIPEPLRAAHRLASLPPGSHTGP
jgi:deoxyribonuclease V